LVLTIPFFYLEIPIQCLYERARPRKYQTETRKKQKQGIALTFRQTIGAAAIAIATFGCGAAHAATMYDYTFNGSNSYGSFSATVSLFTEGGQAISGGGSITGGGLTGPQSLTLVTLSSPGVQNDGGGLLGYSSIGGADWFDAGTAVPIDTDGLIFAMGPGPVGNQTSQQFDVFNNGDDTYGAAFFGSANPGIAPHYYEIGDPVSVSLTTSEVPVPEPATWAMFILGLFGIGFMVRGARRKEVAATA
jgi:hypothetical protein